MWHTSIGDDKFFAELEEEDARVAARVKAARCPHCEGRLDRADYPRKPRSGDSAPMREAMDRRISLCCARDGCRRRATPPSLVFLGRRVYLGIAVLNASLKAMTASENVNAPRATQPSMPPRRTVRRWLWWFREVLPRGTTSSPHARRCGRRSRTRAPCPGHWSSDSRWGRWRSKRWWRRCAFWLRRRRLPVHLAHHPDLVLPLLSLCTKPDGNTGVSGRDR